MEGVGMIAILVVLIAAIAISRKMNKKLITQKPQCKAYVWGYFLGVTGFLSGVIVLLMGIDTSQVLLIIAGGIIILSSYFTVKRYKWALIIITILNLNIFVWVANIFYIKNRWKELS